MRKSDFAPSGSSKTRITKAFHASIRSQAIQELNFIYLLREGIVTTVSPGTPARKQNQSLYVEFEIWLL